MREQMTLVSSVKGHAVQRTVQSLFSGKGEFLSLCTQICTLILCGIEVLDKSRKYSINFTRTCSYHRASFYL